MDYKLFSSDSHADAPMEVYRENTPAKYHDGIPHHEVGPDGTGYLVVRGQRLLTMKPFAEGRAGGAWQNVRQDEGDWKPEVRLKALDIDRVAGEILQGGATWALFDPDPELQMAVAKVWNDWAMSVYKPYLARLNPSATLPHGDIAAACKEAVRLKDLGYTNVQMPINPVEHPYRKRDYDPLWATLEETGLTVNLHIRSGTRKSTPYSAGRVYNYCVDCTDGIVTATDLCSSGVLERFPKLRFVFLEVGGGWAAWLMKTMDGIYDAHPETSFELKRYPSEYMKQSIYCSIMMDEVALKNFDMYPNLIFSTDRPHPEGTWPESQRRVAWQLEGAGLDAEQVEDFTHRNCELLYGFPEETPTTGQLLANAKAAKAGAAAC